MTTATHITTFGGLISAAFIENVREPGSRQRGFEPASFALPWNPAPKSPAAMEDTIATAWELLLERWDAVRNDPSTGSGHGLPMMDVSQVRTRWLLPLFQLLDFDPVYLRGATVLDPDGKLRFPLSHRGWLREDAPRPELAEGPILHTVIPSQRLDERMAGPRGLKSKSPHDMLQAFLNASQGDHWAVLSNGILLRLLRDYHHTFTKGYVEFDLESILETRNYGDFRALYRLCHASRFLPQGEGEEATLPLEQFYKDSIATGIKVGEDLRGQVRQAIETLGNGFLDGDLIHRLQEDEDLCRRYYGEILHVIYRTLFLLFAEQRGMMPGRDSLYAESYSIARLRARAEGDIPREDDFTDLWEGLKVTFRMVREGVPALGVFGYDGMLFEDAGADGHPPLLEGRSICNSDLLRAIRALTLIEREGVLQRISYADLGVEELGSIYESLLDFTPRVSSHTELIDPSTSLRAGGREIRANSPSASSGLRFFLDPRGSERKTTGSYYTHPSLVNELIKSALLPVARDRLAAAGLPVIEEEAIGEAAAGLLADYAALSEEQRDAGEVALLSIKVCDPAVGSGHFLVKADNALGAELARIRSGDEYPPEAEIQAAKRDVLAHCIYAVDLNPMAVELCKVSLWINASVQDRPLSFLDHHIKCGNSLVGATPELIADGIPYEAFALGIAGDDREVAKRFRAKNRQERRDYEDSAGYQLGLQVTVIETMEDLQRWTELTRLAEDDPKMARERYLEYLTADEHRRKKLEADLWTAAFFWPLPKGTRWAPTFAEFLRLRQQGPKALPAERLLEVESLAEQYRFFHWHLEFPDVFSDDGAPQSGDGGFDVVLGNPPWEMINLMEKEFFADKAPEIANAGTGAQRKRLIGKLARTDPELHIVYTQALRDAENTARYLQNSGRFALTSGGRINTYAVFADLTRQLVAPMARAGIVLPLGIATDYTYRDFFADVVGRGQLISFYDFENREGIFPGVHRNYNFALVTFGGARVPRTESEFAFFMTQFDHLQDDARRFALSSKDLALMNPNTHTVPVFRRRRDAETTRKIYTASPVLNNETDGQNPWAASFIQGLFNMTSDSHLFHTCEQLEERAYVPEGNHYQGDDGQYLPLYEAKMTHQFDHRHGTYEGQTAEQVRKGYCREPGSEDYRNPDFVVLPKHWITEMEVIKAAGDWKRRWFLGFRDITRAVDRRTASFSIIPWAAVGNKIPLILFENARSHEVAAFLANVNAFTFDYVVRQKMGGISLNFYIVKQLPVLPPSRYTSVLLDFIVPRVVELTYTAWDLQPFAQDILDEVGPATWARWFESDHLGSPAPVHTSPPPAWAQGPAYPELGEGPPPFVWDEGRRVRLRAELDALYAHLYGLTRDELAYILDTFPIVRRKDEARWGEYRTKRMVLQKYEVLEPLKGGGE